jgi:hypothetical protein
MHHRYLGDVWGVDDHLNPVSKDRFQLVEALAAVQMSSYLVGMIDSTRRTSPFPVGDVRLRRDSAQACPRVLWRPEGGDMQCVGARSDYEAQAQSADPGSGSPLP